MARPSIDHRLVTGRRSPVATVDRSTRHRGAFAGPGRDGVRVRRAPPPSSWPWTARRRYAHDLNRMPQCHLRRASLRPVHFSLRTSCRRGSLRRPNSCPPHVERGERVEPLGWIGGPSLSCVREGDPELDLMCLAAVFDGLDVLARHRQVTLEVAERGTSTTNSLAKDSPLSRKPCPLRTPRVSRGGGVELCRLEACRASLAGQVMGRQRQGRRSCAQSRRGWR